MKNLLIIVLAIATAALAATLAFSTKKPAAAPQELQALKAALAEKEARLAELDAERVRAEEQSRQVAELSDGLAAEAKARETALSNALASVQAAATKGEAAKAGGKDGGFGKMLSSMMNDPDMKKFIQEQQRNVMKQLYDPLVKKLGLTPEEAQKFSDLLSANTEKSMEMATSMFNGGMATNQAALTAQVTADYKRMEQEMKGLLGDDRYSQYQEYQATVGERVQLNQYRQQHSGPDAITEEQSEHLLALMREEKQRVAESSGLNFPGQDPGSVRAVFDENQTDRFLQAQQTVNQNVYSRAAEVLSPGQLESFGRFQSEQLQNLRMGLTMARKFMGSEGSSTGN